MTNYSDSKSPPGSWQTEWDARPHSIPEYRAEIYDLRRRILSYLDDIKMRDHVIAELRGELGIILRQRDELENKRHP
jgi:hypothetical protein